MNRETDRMNKIPQIFSERKQLWLRLLHKPRYELHTAVCS